MMIIIIILFYILSKITEKFEITQLQSKACINTIPLFLKIILFDAAENIE